MRDLTTLKAVIEWAEAVPCDECGHSNTARSIVWPPRVEVAARIAKALRVLATWEAHEEKYKGHFCDRCDRQCDDCPCTCSEPYWISVYELRAAVEGESLMELKLENNTTFRVLMIHTAELEAKLVAARLEGQLAVLEWVQKRQDEGTWSPQTVGKRIAELKAETEKL